MTGHRSPTEEIVSPNGQTCLTAEPPTVESQMPRYRWPCRTWLISTVESPAFLEKQRASQADAILLELEAGTVDKGRARELAAAAIRELDYGSKYRVIRINPWDSPHARADLEATIPTGPDAIMLTKVTSAEQVRAADTAIGELESTAGLPSGSVELVLMIETAAAVLWAREIATASDRIVALCFGGGDYTADIHARVTVGTNLPVAAGLEILWARSVVVAAARMVGVSPIDVPLGNVHDDANTLVHGFQSRALGFDGMIALSPSQIGPITQAFTPTSHEVDRAKRVVTAFDRAYADGRGVVGVDNEMVSDTIAEWYRDVLRRAGHA